MDFFLLHLISEWILGLALNLAGTSNIKMFIHKIDLKKNVEYSKHSKHYFLIRNHYFQKVY